MIGKTLYVGPARGVNIRKSPSTKAEIVRKLPQGTRIGVAIKSSNQSDGIWYQIADESWVRGDIVYTMSELPKGFPNDVNFNKDGNAVVKAIIASDQELYDNLLIIREQLDRVVKKGINARKIQDAFARLVEEYRDRQESIKRIETLDKIKEYAYKPVAWLQQKWADAKSAASYLLGIGALPLIPIAIGAVSGIVGTVALYYLFKPKYDLARANLIESDELRAALDRLDPVTATKIKNDLEDQIDDAYKRGSADGYGGSIANLLKLGIGFVLAIQLKDLTK